MANVDDKDKKIGEVPHLTEVTGNEKIPVSADGEPRYVEVQQIREGLQPEGNYLTQEDADKRYATPNDIPDTSNFVTESQVDEKLAKLPVGGVTWGRIGKQVPETTVIRLNQTISDPYSMLSGEFGKDGTPSTNVISWIRANSHRYVGNYDAEQGMVLRQLDDNNSELYADGSDASEDIKGTNGGDVFMKMPDFWFKGVNVDGNADIVDMHFSAKEPTDEGWTKWDGNTLIGAYEAVAENTEDNTTGLCFSRSGATPTVKVSQANFKAKARNKSNGDDHFQIVTYEAHQVMALLYMAYYGNTNGQAQIGVGTTSYPKVAGQTNVDGMNDTVAEKSRSINFWGLENWWGDIFEWVDNILSETGLKNNGIATIRDYDNTLVRRVSGCATNIEEIQKMMLGEILDMFPKSNTANNSYSTYYCDYGGVNTSASNVALHSGMSAVVTSGPFFFTLSNASSFNNDTNGTRLLYHGRVTISNAKARSILKARSIAPIWKPIDLQYVYRDGKPTLRTGFDFNICNVSTLKEVGKLSLYGLNIAYQDIEFESNALSSDKEGNLTFNTDSLPISVDMNYKGQLIGTLKFYDISEEELIERQRQMKEQSEEADTNA